MVVRVVDSRWLSCRFDSLFSFVTMTKLEAEPQTVLRGQTVCIAL